MRQATGGTWLLQLMILFILLFVAFITLTLNYSKTNKVKNDVLTIIEKYEGLNDQSLEIVDNMLITSGYNGKGHCEAGSGVYGNKELKGKLETASNSEK